MRERWKESEEGSDEDINWMKEEREKWAFRETELCVWVCSCLCVKVFWAWQKWWWLNFTCYDEGGVRMFTVDVRIIALRTYIVIFFVSRSHSYCLFLFGQLFNSKIDWFLLISKSIYSFTIIKVSSFHTTIICSNSLLSHTIPFHSIPFLLILFPQSILLRQAMSKRSAHFLSSLLPHITSPTIVEKM